MTIIARSETTAKQDYAHCETQDGNPTRARIDARGGRGLMGKRLMRLGMQEEHAPLDGDRRGGNLAESRDARTFDVGCRCCVDRETRAKPWRISADLAD